MHVCMRIILNNLQLLVRCLCTVCLVSNILTFSHTHLFTVYLHFLSINFFFFLSVIILLHENSVTFIVFVNKLYICMKPIHLNLFPFIWNFNLFCLSVWNSVLVLTCSFKILDHALVVGFLQVAGADRLTGAGAVLHLLPALHLLFVFRFLSPLFHLFCISDLSDLLTR